jgi:hypothetical protein
MLLEKVKKEAELDVEKIKKIEQEKQELDSVQQKATKEKHKLREALESSQMDLVSTVSPDDIDSLFEEVKNMQAFRLQKFLTEAEQKIAMVTKKLVKNVRKSDESTRNELKTMQKMIEDIQRTSMMNTSKDEVVALKDEVKALRVDIEENNKTTHQQLDIALTRRALASDLQDLENQKHTSEIVSEMIKNSQYVAALKSEIQALRRELKVAGKLPAPQTAETNDRTSNIGQIHAGSTDHELEPIDTTVSQAVDDITRMESTIEELKSFSSKIKASDDIKSIKPEIEAFREKLEQNKDIFRKAELVRLKTYREMREEKEKMEEEAFLLQLQEQERKQKEQEPEEQDEERKSLEEQAHEEDEEEESEDEVEQEQEQRRELVIGSAKETSTNKQGTEPDAKFQLVKSRVAAFANVAVAAPPSKKKQEMAAQNFTTASSFSNKFKEEVERRAKEKSFILKQDGAQWQKDKAANEKAKDGGHAEAEQLKAASNEELLSATDESSRDSPSTGTSSSEDDTSTSQDSSSEGQQQGPTSFAGSIGQFMKSWSFKSRTKKTKADVGDRDGAGEREGVDDGHDDNHLAPEVTGKVGKCPRHRLVGGNNSVSCHGDDGDDAYLCVVKSTDSSSAKGTMLKKQEQSPPKRQGKSSEVKKLATAFLVASCNKTHLSEIASMY